MNIWDWIDSMIEGAKTLELPNLVKRTKDDNLSEAALTRGSMVIGDPSMGKTEYVCNQIYKTWTEHHNKAVFVFDWSGPLTNALLRRVAQDPKWEERMKKVVLNQLGHPEKIIPQPEFHPDYGLTQEEQIARVIGNLERLAQFLLKGAPFLAGVAIEELGRNLFSLLVSITNTHGETWQITEAKRLLMDMPLLEKAISKFGTRCPDAAWYFRREYLPKDIMKGTEKELSSRALRYMFGKTSGISTRATLGYYKPTVTPKEVTEKGLLYIIDAHLMNNLPEAQHYLLMQQFSQIMSWINKREVDADDPPAMIAFDETYTILKIPGMAEWLGMVSPIYRSRKIQLLIIIQALWQLDEQLAKQIWTLGNIVSFAVSNSNEAEEIAKQLFKYNPISVKQQALTPYQNPTTEPVAGQNRIYADWIQSLQARQMIMRRYITEQKREEYVQFVNKTADTPIAPLNISLPDLKEYLINSRGVSVRDALEEINKRMNTKTETELPNIG